MAIISKIQKRIIQYSLLKPLSTILIITIAINIHLNGASMYTLMILIALLFSLIGDLFLLRDSYFIWGLLSFLIAHIILTISFTSLHGFHTNYLILLLLLSLGGGYYFYLFKDLKKFKLPVLVYMLVIISMSWQAISLASYYPKTVYIEIAFASLLFILSDALIAYTKFKKDLKMVQVLILATYWLALYIFTISGIKNI
jgi:uncharacterized membrane protein YhhN